MAKSQTAILRDVLRELLKSSGLHYNDVARRLDVSERTVRRWFSSDRTDTQVLEQLCAVAGISFFELCEIAAKQVDARPTHLTHRQEEVLADNPFVNYLFAQVRRNWTVAELREEMDVTEAAIIDGLLQLEKIGLIDLLPGNVIKMRVSKTVERRPRGPLSRKINKWLAMILNKPDVNEPRSLWTLDTLNLSAASHAHMKRRFEELHQEIRALSDADRATQQPREWFSFALAVRPRRLLPFEEW